MAGPVVEPQPLMTNHFRSDRTGNLTEDQLNEILDAPVFLEATPRVGLLPVATAYAVDAQIPLNSVPRALSEALESTGYFEVSTEMSSDWPAQGSIAGLRELAARYRVEYLLLYRHRFVDRERLNGWGWTYPTVVGYFAAPARTLEVAGVMEATLFDVRTGTIMFTVQQRVHDERRSNIWHNDMKTRRMKEGLLEEATTDLATQVTDKVARLVAARPEDASKVARAPRISDAEVAKEGSGEEESVVIESP